MYKKLNYIYLLIIICHNKERFVNEYLITVFFLNIFHKFINGINIRLNNFESLSFRYVSIFFPLLAFSGYIQILYQTMHFRMYFKTETNFSRWLF